VYNACSLGISLQGMWCQFALISLHTAVRNQLLGAGQWDAAG
jgi:hypothetical protein